MKLLNLFLLSLSLVEIYGQRIRTVNSNKDVSTPEPKTARVRGRTRFSADQDIPQSSERPSSNRRASTRTRIHSNNPKAAADRRARPTEAPLPSRGYAVEEINNDSPIDSFRRQSRPRVLTESRFDIPTVTVSPRRTQVFQSRAASASTVNDKLPLEDVGFGSTARAILQARGESLSPKTTTEDIPDVRFGSTARAILQSRGEPLPAKTTTPVIDEEYLLNNFGTTFKTLAALNNEVSIQRATPLRSEVPIIDKEDIPRRSSLRGDPLPSLRGSDISAERQPSRRGRKKPRVKPVEEPARSNTKFESLEKPVEPSIVEEIVRIEPEPDAPEYVQGLFEQSESVTETQPLDVSSESILYEEEDLRKTSGAEVVTQKITEPIESRRTVVNTRRNGARAKSEAVVEYQPSSRTISSRTRTNQRPEEINAASSTRSRGTRRRYDDAEVAESRSRGPSIFTVEQYQEVTSRSRTGRRIDNKIESIPERIADLAPSTTIKSRSSGRRATTARTTSTERSSVRDRNSSRGRSRSRSYEESTTAPISRSPTSRSRSSSNDDTSFYGEKTNSRADVTQIPSRTETNRRIDVTEPRAAISRASSVESGRRETSRRIETPEPRSVLVRTNPAETSSNRRGSSRFDTINSRSNSRASVLDNRREILDKIESIEPINIISSRNSVSREDNIPDEEIAYGEKSTKTRTQSPQTTTTTEDPITIVNRSRNRFSETPPKIDESKLEVLPLFERNTKPVSSVRSRGHRSKSSVNRRQNPTRDHMHVSATEDDVKFVEKPTTNAFTKMTVTRTESVEASTSRMKISTRTASTTTSTTTTTEETTRRPTSTTTTTVKTTTTPETTSTTEKWITRAPPLIRESVVAEVNEVTSKSSIRRKKVSKAKAAEVLAGGSKKADIKVGDVGKKKASSEEIGEDENYPEPFKTLIQAKKKQEVSRPPSTSSPRPTAVPAIKIMSTEKVFVTSSASPSRGSSTARIVTTESPSAGKRSQLVNEIINDNENELDPKPTSTTQATNAPTRPARVRPLPKFSEKPKYVQKPREKYNKSGTEKPRYSPEKVASKTTATPRKSYSPKSMYATRDPVEHHSRRKALRSTAFPPSTTPTNLVTREAKFSAKFIRKETDSIMKGLKNNGTQYTKGYYNNKRGNEKDNREGDKTGRKLDGSVLQSPKPTMGFKKINASRYSSRYRSDPSQRSTVLRTTTSAPFYIPTIPTPAYVPTVPTMAPPVTTVGEYIVEKDKDLGLEVISFDDPVNTIPSADLVNGELLTMEKNIKLSPMVKNGTTEKPVSIIERIINSITAISTTAVPNITTTTPSPLTSAGATENSAILKLAPKKTTSKDKTLPDDETNIIETITSEKPTTIIEKIRNSLSAIQSNEVGTSDYDIISGSSTTPLSTVTKYSAKFRGSSVGTTALPAPLPLSTSINPLSVFDEIDRNQVLEKRTIGKLLNILNGLVSSTNSPKGSEKLVVVTPKSVLNSMTSPSGFVATTFSSQEPLEAIVFNELEPRAAFVDISESSSVIPVFSSTVNTETTSSGSTVNIDSSTSNSIVNTESSTISSVVNTETTTSSTETVSVGNTDLSMINDQINTDSTTIATPTQTGSNTETSLRESNEISTLMSIQTESVTDQSSTTMASDFTPATTISSSTTTVKSSEASVNALAIDLTTASTITTEESTITVKPPETTTIDTTITSSESTTNVDGLSSSTFYTYPSTIPTIPNIEVSPGSVSIFSANDLYNLITPEDNLFNTVTIASRVGFDNNNVLTSTTTTESATSTTLDSTTNTESATMATTTDAPDMTTQIPSTTEDGTTIATSTIDDLTTILSTTVSEESTTVLTTTMSSNTSNATSSSNPPVVFNRSGRILSSDIGEPVDNSIAVSARPLPTSTTPDYFIFAVLNNNTILRKRPPTIPNKETPFIIVGLYPNNTVVRKFPNGTLVPMEQIIKVRGFDIRPNPPPLVEITSNQVTDTTNGMTLDNNSVTVESNRMGRLFENGQSVNSLSSRIAISSTVSSTSAPTTTTTTTTTLASSTTPTSTTSRPTMMSTASTTPMTSTPMSSTTTETSVPSTTTLGTTMMLTSTLPSSTTAQSTTSTNIVRIMAIPGETRISKAQTTTTEEPSTVQSSTTQAPTSTIAQSTETIPPSLGEILNGKTVDALANLLTADVPTTKAPNYKTLEINQNSITSSTTVQNTTTELSTEGAAPFTSPALGTETATQFPTSADRLLSSTLITTLMPPSTTTESTTPKITITSTTEPSTTTTSTTTRQTTTTVRTTTPEITTTTQRIEPKTQKLTTTVMPTVKTTVAPITTTVAHKTTTSFPTFNPSTIFPSILTTLFPNLLRNVETTPSSPLSSTRRPFVSADLSNTIGDGFEVLSTAGTTARSATVLPQTSTSKGISTTTPPPTTTTQTTEPSTTTTTTTEKLTTTIKPKPTTTKASKSATPTPSTKEETDALFEQLKKSGKLKNLNEEQRRNLEEIERIEKEQAELLRQLALVTTMFGGQVGKLPNLPPMPSISSPMGGNSLANRVIAMAMERDRAARASTTPPETTTKKVTTKPTTKRPNSIQDQLPVTGSVTQRTTPSLEDVLKQYNLNSLSTPAPLTSTYGTSDEALLAAILKEHGIGPTTPKVLGDKVKEAGIFEENPTTKPPKPKSRPRATTTARPIGGRLMQGLNWLLDILDPPTTKRPAPRKPKAKPQPAKQNADEELLTNQPTRITPVVTAAPVTRPNLSQEEIQVRTNTVHRSQGFENIFGNSKIW